MPYRSKRSPGQIDGVSFDARKGKWVARPYLPTGRTFLGHFPTRHEAEIAVIAARFYFETPDSFVMSLEAKFLFDYENGDPQDTNPALERAASINDTAASDALALADLLGLMTGTQQQIATKLSEGYTVEEIAQALEQPLGAIQQKVLSMRQILITNGYAPKHYEHTTHV